MKTTLIVLLRASVLLATTSPVSMASPPPDLASVASPHLSPYERPCRPEEEGIKSAIFGEHKLTNIGHHF